MTTPSADPVLRYGDLRVGDLFIFGTRSYLVTAVSIRENDLHRRDESTMMVTFYIDPCSIWSSPFHDLHGWTDSYAPVWCTKADLRLSVSR